MLDLKIFAYHVQQFFTTKGKFTLYTVEGLKVEVEIKNEQVYLDGVWVGNRQGGAQAFAKIVSDYLDDYAVDCYVKEEERGSLM